MAEFSTAAEYPDKLREVPIHPHRGYLDVHAHLFHEEFAGDEALVEGKCVDAGLQYVVLNGLEPDSNREVLAMCERHPSIYLPALGIYPLDAACNVISRWEHEFPQPAKFDIEAEVAFIDSMAEQRRIVAIGECGLDGFYLTDPVSLVEQERVLRLMCAVAKKHDLPIILHSRKAENRVFEILQEEGVVKADFHCYCGKAKLAQKIAEAGYFLSIPSCVERNQGFQQLVAKLPMNRILTETDSPYQGPDRGERNDPSTVPRGIAAIAKVRFLAGESAPIKQHFPLNEDFTYLNDSKPFVPPLSETGSVDKAQQDAYEAECLYVRNMVRQNFKELFGF